MRLKVKRKLIGRALAGLSLPALAVLGLLIFEEARLPDARELIRCAPFSTVLLDREGTPIRYALTAREELAPRVPLEKIHRHLREATVAAEDGRFRSHPGVDGLAIARAIATNLRRGRIVSGASTITMQAARLIRPLERSWYGKFREAVLALYLERILTKDEILELYLNLSPYGGNVRGVEAAALRYFGRSAGDLSLSEAALIAGLPQSPARLRPDRYPERAKTRRDWVLDRMEALGLADPRAVAEAKAAGIHLVSKPLPLVAPHFGNWALGRVAPGERVKTSLDPAVQAMAEEALRARLEALGPFGVRNGAAVVAETGSGKIRAFVGSQDFFAPRGGQVNGASAHRSPGSLLKPFIYGLAFEKGIAGPDTVLEDRPRLYRDGYEPRNFTGEFAGPVTARDALARSLNLPAVDLLSRVGVKEAIERLRGLGLQSIRGSAGHYGLSLGLGGVEVSLLELVEAYAALGRLGEHRPLSFREDEPPKAARRALSPLAAFDVAGILEAVAWKPGERDGGLKLPRVCMKTGTSFGFRDAWAIAYTPRWTVGVWFGNFDSEPSPALVGQTAAVPAALEMVRRLAPLAGEGWFARPAEKESGNPAPGALAPGEKPPGGVRWLLPPDRATFARHERAGGGDLKLRAEIERAELAPPVGPQSAPRPSPEPPAELSWFVDGSFAGRTRSGETLVWPLHPGAHKVTLVPPAGQAQVRTVTVER